MSKQNFAQSLFSLLQLQMGQGSVNGYPLQLDARKKLDLMEDEFCGLSLDQSVALNEILLGDNHVVTVCGKAGTGKTYFIKFLKKVFGELFNVNLIVVASTGIASQNCGGAGTLHSVFGVGTGNKLPWDWTEEDTDYARKNALRCAYKAPSHSPLSNLDIKVPTVVLVDELSMISSELLNVIYQIALYRHGAEQSAPTAAKSVQFVCLGDTMQLLPIKPKSKKTREITNFPWHRAQYYLNGETHQLPSLLKEGCFEGFKAKSLGLITNHRQKEEREFAEALNYIRLGGKINEGPARLLKDCIVKNEQEIPDGLDTIHTYYTNKETFKRNREVVESLPKDQRKTYYADVEYTPPGKGSNKVMGPVVGEVEETVKGRKQKLLKVYDRITNQEKKISKNWIPDWALPIQELGIGLPFMIRQNMPAKDLYNGTVGIIKEFDQQGKSVTIELENGERHVVEKTTCNGVSLNWKGEPMGTYVSLPGHVASAMTVNKSQGLTINKPLVVHINSKYSKSIPPHWVYVAFSRVTRKDLLYIDADVATINEAIKIEESALEFTQEAERNMQEFTGGSLITDTVTPQDIKDSKPLLRDVAEEGRDLLRFHFRVYLEIDYSYDVSLLYNRSTQQTEEIYDYDEEDYIDSTEWPQFGQALELVKEYVEHEYDPKERLDQRAEES